MPRGDADFPQANDELADQASQLSEGDPLPSAPAFGALSVTPPLATLCAVAAVAHLTLQRLLLPLLVSQKVQAPAALRLAAPFSLNVAGCAGLVAFVAGSYELLRARDLTATSRRLLIGALSGVLVSTLALSIFAPAGHVSVEHIMVSTGALHTLVVQLAMVTLRRVRSPSGRTTAGLVAASSVFALLSLLLRHVGPTNGTSGGLEAIRALHGLGELAFLLVPIASAFILLPWEETSQARFARRSGAVAVCAMAVVFSAAARIPDALYGHLLYSTLRLEWALDRASLGYAVPIGLAVGAATAAMLSRDPRHRQGGTGLWLWLAGGYNPLTPARLLMAALGATLVCRAILTAGEEPNSDAPDPAR
jgi:hypothetical protein